MRRLSGRVGRSGGRRRGRSADTAGPRAPSPGRGRQKQAQELAFFPIWSYAHPSAIELADRLADYAPGDLNRVFFSTGGGEAVETAFKLAKYYWKLKGQPSPVENVWLAVVGERPVFQYAGVPTRVQLPWGEVTAMVSAGMLCSFVTTDPGQDGQNTHVIHTPEGRRLAHARHR